MNDEDTQQGQGGFEPPEKRVLLEATGIAAGVALVVLVAFILPAEYGIDPTGFGQAIGIKDIASPSGAGSLHKVEDHAWRNDTATIIVPAGTGLEYKFYVDEGSSFVYDWNATGALFFDFHGEPLNDDTGYFESYDKATAGQRGGGFTAPFEGTHGWYWQNDGEDDVTVTLRTAGHYVVVGLR